MTAWDDIGKIYILFGAVLAVAVPAFIWMLTRLKIHEAIKFRRRNRMKMPTILGSRRRPQRATLPAERPGGRRGGDGQSILSEGRPAGTGRAPRHDDRL